MSNEHYPTVAEVEESILKGTGVSISSGLAGIVCEVRERYSGPTKPSPDVVAQAVWSLISRGLAYFHPGPGSSFPPTSDNWRLDLTERGWKAAKDTPPNPDLPEKYLQGFVQDIPEASPVVVRYVQEALGAYGNQLYMASAVMLGVASEGVFLEVVEAFGAWLQQEESAKLAKFTENPRTSFNVLLTEFRKRLDSHKGHLPPELREDYSSYLDSILNMIRKYRNDAGHPTGVEIDRGTCHLSLTVFAESAKRLYSLKRHFEDAHVEREA